MLNPYKSISKVNPQPDNGHRRINNDVMTAIIKSKMSGAVLQVVLYVIDRSWGYQSLEATLGYSQICKATGLSKRAVINAVQQAEKAHLIVVNHGDTRTMTANTYLFNKYYDTWVTSEVSNTSEVNNTRTSEVNGNFTSEVLTNKPSFAKEKGGGVGRGLPPINKKEKRIYIENNKKKKEGVAEPNKDPDRFIKGRYGHMVRR